MKKDGIADMVSKLLRQAFDDVTRERIPDDLRQLVDRLPRLRDEVALDALVRVVAQPS